MACNLGKKIWSREDLEKIYEMRRAGFSAREIGLQFGVSKNAICGVVGRNKTDAGDLPAKTVTRPVRVRLSRRPAMPSGEYMAKREQARQLQPLGFDMFSDRGCCKFIASDHSQCCNRPVEQHGSSWCNAHRYVVYRPARAA